MKFHSFYFGTMHALVSIFERDGSVSITHGGIEMGQGINSKAAQTAAHILGIPLDMISIKPTNNMTSPNAVMTGASIGSEVACFVSFNVHFKIIHNMIKSINSIGNKKCLRDN